MAGDHQNKAEMKRLNEALLRPGDIILSTTTAAVSAAIRATTRSDISHAIVYVEDRSVIDATGEGVQARNTQRLFFEASCPVYILRVRDGISPQQLEGLRTYVRSAIGTRYSKREAVLAAFGGARQWSRQQFCSRLVAQAFASVGIGLVSDPNYCSPADLQTSSLLEPVQEATLPVSPEEAAAWEGHLDVPQRMRDATNALLSGARAMDPRIETFNDLNGYLVAHSNRDEEMCRILQASGYLSVWQVEKDKNPWQYDLALMKTMPEEIIDDYCWGVLANEDGSPNRYIVNRGAYSFLYRMHKFQYFREMTSLHELLATLHRQRVDTARRWLEKNGRLAHKAMATNKPHSPAWFAILERWDPAQAMMTRKVIELTGREDVCSICGDDPAADYRLPAKYRSAGGVDTLRLCNDCVQIRQALGEPFAPLGIEGQPRT